MLDFSPIASAFTVAYDWTSLASSSRRGKKYPKVHVLELSKCYQREGKRGQIGYRSYFSIFTPMLMSQRFVAIDFETANADLASICQVGIATFQDGELIETWESLINPLDYFDWFNVEVHGIDEYDVVDAPTFPQVASEILRRIENRVVVSHTSFDRTALYQAMVRHKLAEVPCQWLDTARVVRRAWGQWSHRGYGLTNVCRELGIVFNAHNALEDARAAGEVLLQAFRATGLGLEEWIIRARQPINPEANEPIAREGNPEGVLFGHEIVFTGALVVTRREAAVLAAESGCTVAGDVRKTTTLLVVGDQDIDKLAGNDKSSKHRKAEKLISKGQKIRILKEGDFLHIAGLES
ncbi:exonuclease domain-containing protein [Nitrosospira sp. Is2]|uniref:exonuclease domain-containing protein n=1 Tax=Nitrosospira sp. Is2 TaxID=3080532 RepID=UPI002954D36A|nr:exonuclease domain-containing protein [Nitrosospira sp. Is2]WON74775.1 exonuclease domain-containing protein [Nitrosospira sp. Is2]